MRVGSTSSNTSLTLIGRPEPTAAATAGAVTSGGTTNPVRKSRSRRPARGASTVSAIASKPDSTASSISAAVTPRSLKQ